MFSDLFNFIRSLCIIIIPDFHCREYENLEYSKKYFPNDFNELKKLNIEEF